MKSKRSLLFLPLVLLLGLSSCKVHFTHQTKEELESSDVNLKKIQYYNSRDIRLKRYITKKETQVASGEVTTKKGKFIEIIEIEKNTPGVCDSIGKDRLWVRFERGEGRVLVFERDNSVDDHYQLAAMEWDREEMNLDSIPLGNTNYASYDRSTYTGKIEYAGNIYYTQSFSEKPELLIKKKNTSTTQTKKRKAEGIEVE